MDPGLAKLLVLGSPGLIIPSPLPRAPRRAKPSYRKPDSLNFKCWGTMARLLRCFWVRLIGAKARLLIIFQHDHNNCDSDAHADDGVFRTLSAVHDTMNHGLFRMRDPVEDPSVKP